MEFSDQVQASTNTVFIPKAVDQVLEGNPFCLRVLGNAKKWRGTQIKRTIIFEKQSNGKSFSGLDTFNTNTSDTKRKLAYDPRGYTIPVVIPGMERDVNASDPNASIDLVTEAIEEAKNAMIDDIGALFYGDGTGNSSKDPLGLAALVDDGGEVATIGGLSRTTYTKLASNEYDIVGDVELVDLATAVSAATQGSNRITIHFTTPAKWDEYEALLQPTVRNNIQSEGYRQMTRTGIAPNRGALEGDLGFDALFFRGAPVVADDNCPANKWYGLNEKHIAWYGLNSASKKYTPINVGGDTQIEGEYANVPSKYMGFNWSGLQESINQYAEIGHIILMGNLVTFRPNTHFAINFS